MTRALLVTGGAGFIGSPVAAAAVEAGWQVRVLDSLRGDVHPARSPIPADVTFVEGDVTDPDTVAAALEGVEAVCHQAAKVGLGVDLGDAPDYVHTNQYGTAVLLAQMTRARVDRLVLASSMVVYGEGGYRDARGPIAPSPRRGADLDAGRFEPRSPRTGEPLEPALVDEDAPLDPRSVYAAAKLGQEHLADIWARETGGRAAMLRYHNVYGPGMPRDTPYAGVASIFRSQLAAGRAPQVFEDGLQRRDFVHVQDVAAANIAALDWTSEAPGGSARAFNVGSGTVHTILDLATALSTAMGGPTPVVTGRHRAGDVRHITASSARAASELGWRARIGFEEGIAQFARAPQRGAARDTQVDR